MDKTIEILKKHKKSLEEYQVLHGHDKDLIPVIKSVAHAIEVLERVRDVEGIRKAITISGYGQLRYLRAREALALSQYLEGK